MINTQKARINETVSTEKLKIPNNSMNHLLSSFAYLQMNNLTEFFAFAMRMLTVQTALKLEEPSI